MTPWSLAINCGFQHRIMSCNGALTDNSMLIGTVFNSNNWISFESVSLACSYELLQIKSYCEAIIPNIADIRGPSSCSQAWRTFFNSFVAWNFNMKRTLSARKISTYLPAFLQNFKISNICFMNNYNLWVQHFSVYIVEHVNCGIRHFISTTAYWMYKDISCNTLRFVELIQILHN